MIMMSTSLEAISVALESVAREASVRPFSLQHTKGHHATGEMMQLSPLRTCLTAISPALILAPTHACFDVCPHPVESADLCRRQRQVVGGVVLGAVSDHQHFQPLLSPPLSLRYEWRRETRSGWP
jgi:hypothetical protein